MAGTTTPALVLCAANLLLIAALPRLFFRRGRLNGAWWATASPFALAGATLCAAVASWLSPTPAFPHAGTISAAVATLLAGTSIGVIGYTLGSHHHPVSLWHQPDDAPVALVTRGAYARVRHPFYAAFIAALAACAIAVPHPLTLLALAAGILQLYRTATREERRLIRVFGEEYAEYMRRTGRFFPRPSSRGNG